MDIEDKANAAIKDSLECGHALIKCKNVSEAEALLARLDARIPHPSDRRWQEMFPGQHRYLIATIIRNKEVNVFSVCYYTEKEDDDTKPLRIQLSRGGHRWRSDVITRPPKKPKKPRKKKPRYMNLKRK